MNNIPEGSPAIFAMHGMKKQVTVIIPNKNYTHFIDAAIESVKEQTVRCDLTVIDYGSTDPHPETTHYMKSVELRELTLSEARNSAVSRATTPYILCLDADDTLEPDAVEIMLNHAGPRTIVATGLRYFGDMNYTMVPLGTDLSEFNQIAINSLFPKKLWQEIGGWDESLSGYEDWDFWLRAQKAGYEIVIIPEILANIRSHADGRNMAAVEKHDELKAYIKGKHD